MTSAPDAAWNRTRRKAGLVVLAALLLPALARAEPQELRFGWKRGLELRYRLRIDGRTTVTLGERSGSSSLHTNLHLTQRVLALSRDGAARILTRVESGRTRSAEGRAKVMPPREGTMRMDDRGNILDGSAMETGAAPLQLVFPRRRLKIGDSWFNSLPPSQEIPVPIRVRYTLVRTRQEAGYRCIEIQLQIQSAKASALEGPMELDFQGAGTILFAPDPGVIVSSEVSSDLTLLWEQPGPEGPVPARTRASFDMRMQYRP